MTDAKLEALTYAIYEFLDPAYLNKWVSVKERSVSSIFEKWGVSRLYSTAFYQILKEKGLIEREGYRMNLSYKIITDVIPDAGVIAKQIVERYTELQQKGGYPMSKPSDLQPKKVKQPKENLSGKPVFQPKTPLQLGDIRYFMYDDLIYECRVVSTFYREDSVSNESLYCDVEVVTDSTLNKTVHSIRQCKLFKSPDDVLKYLKLKVVKYKRQSK